MPSVVEQSGQSVPPTCEVRGWQVFMDGYHKGSLYPLTEIQQIADNAPRVARYMTPHAGIGHDKMQRLAASVGVPSSGDVVGVRHDGHGNLFLDITNVPTWLGAQINAGRYPGGSVELKRDFKPPNDPANPIPGTYLDGVAFLGEEQPAVKGCQKPVATFRDGTPVPPSWEPVPIPKGPFSPPDADASIHSALCFSDAVEVPTVDPKIQQLVALGLTPEQAAKALEICAAACDMADMESTPGGAAGGTSVPTGAPMAGANMTVGDKSPNQDKQKGAMELFDEWDRPSRNHSDASGTGADNKPLGTTSKDGANNTGAEEDWKGLVETFSAFMSDCKKRFSAIDAEKMEEKKDKESSEMAAFSARLDDFYSRNDNSKRVTPAAWGEIKNSLTAMRFKTHFSDTKVRDSEIQSILTNIERLPINPLLKRGGSAAPTTTNTTPAATPAPMPHNVVAELSLTPGGQRILREYQTAGAK